MVAKPKKRGESSVVVYMRVKPEEHARLMKIVKERGWPHTIASVTAEIFSRGLAAEPSA